MFKPTPHLDKPYLVKSCGISIDNRTLGTGCSTQKILTFFQQKIMVYFYILNKLMPFKMTLLCLQCFEQPSPAIFLCQTTKTNTCSLTSTFLLTQYNVCSFFTKLLKLVLIFLAVLTGFSLICSKDRFSYNKAYVSLVVRKPVFWVSTRSDTNWAVQPLKMSRDMKFRI